MTKKMKCPICCGDAEIIHGGEASGWHFACSYCHTTHGIVGIKVVLRVDHRGGEYKFIYHDGIYRSMRECKKAVKEKFGADK